MCYYLIVDTMKSTHESLELAQGLDFLHRHDDGVCRNVSGQVGATGCITFISLWSKVTRDVKSHEHCQQLTKPLPLPECLNHRGVMVSSSSPNMPVKRAF